MKTRSLLLTLSLLLLPACTPDVAMEEDADTPPEATIQIAWKTLETDSNYDTPHVGLFLVLSGSMDREISAGNVPGMMMEQPLVREWWAGTEQAFYLERADATHIVMRFQSLEDPDAGAIVTTIAVPEGDIVECVDTGGCV